MLNNHELPRLPLDVDGAARRSNLSFPDIDWTQRFDLLLDEEDSLVDEGDVEEIVRDFLVLVAPH